jgi:translation initiation factor 2B subunit (eIF-2B alpha/beta/delta family)
MGRAAASIAAAIAAFLVEVGRVLGVRQATRQIAADATRESEAARAAVAKAQAEAKAKGDVIATLRRGEL